MLWLTLLALHFCMSYTWFLKYSILYMPHVLASSLGKYAFQDKLKEWPLNYKTRQGISDFDHRHVWTKLEFMLIWKAYFMQSVFQNAASGIHQIRERWQLTQGNGNRRIGWHKDVKTFGETTDQEYAFKIPFSFIQGLIQLLPLESTGRLVVFSVCYCGLLFVLQ